MKQMINLKEYRLGKEKKNAKRLGRESAEAVAKGDAAVYSRNVGRLSKGKKAKVKLNSFQKSFEKGVKEEEEEFNEQPVNNLVGEIRLSETQLLQVIKESVIRMLDEAFKSPKLNAMAKQHGGMAKWYKDYGTDIPFSDLTDDMIDDNVTKYDPYSKNGSIQFGDGTGIGLTRDGKNYSKNWYNKEIDGTYDNPLINQNRYYPTTERGKMANSIRRGLGQSMRNLNNPQKQDPQTQQRIQGMIKDMRNHTNQMYNNKGMYK